MKLKIIAVLLMLTVVVSISGCASKVTKTSTDQEETGNKQKIIVVAVDKETKAPIKDAKVYILGENIPYTTDEMGKTQEIDVELSKDYFTKYSEEITSRMRSGFISVAVISSGYGKHLETDCNIYPGDSISIVRVELLKGNDYTVKANAPDISYIENLVKTYEKYESEEIKSDNTVKYKVTIVDEKNKPIEGVKTVIPEAKGVNTTNKNGSCEFNIPFDNTSISNYPVKKDYAELTVITYKEGYLSKVVLKAPLIMEEKTNTAKIKIKKSNKSNVEYEVIKPNEKWVKSILDSCKE